MKNLMTIFVSLSFFTLLFIGKNVSALPQCDWDGVGTCCGVHKSGTGCTHDIPGLNHTCIGVPGIVIDTGTCPY